MNQNQQFFDTKVFGHPAGLFVLFFTEMWERFSFYGMRVLLINFLTMTLIGYNPGWEWSAENAGALFGTYAMLLYITPIFGGILADKYLGYSIAVVIGSILMTLGHVSMAFETEASLYIGLGLLVIGTGFFKPNMTSIVSEMYKFLPEKKDGAYTIFYMGVNAGAFFGMMLCGYMAEKIGWSWGFGLAGIFMLLGTLQFWLAKPLFGGVGDKPNAASRAVKAEAELKEDPEVAKRNPFTPIDLVLIVITSIIGLLYAFNDFTSKQFDLHLLPQKIYFNPEDIKGQTVVVVIGLLLFIGLVISRILRYTAVVRDRMFAFIIFAFFTIFFWMAFEQGATSLVIFARDNVQRELLGNSAIIYNIINTLLTVIPLALITYVLFLLAKRTGKKVPWSNAVLILCFGLMWAVVGWMLKRDYDSVAYSVQYTADKVLILDDNGEPELNDKDELQYKYIALTETDLAGNYIAGGELIDTIAIIGEPNLDLTVGATVYIIQKDKDGTTFGYLPDDKIKQKRDEGLRLKRDDGLVMATVVEKKNNWAEITVSWFSILNSFFIIVFASMFSKWWDSKYNPSAALKYGLGLIIMAVGFGLLAVGTTGVNGYMKVSMIWLILAYLFHTLGELCLSPVGLSYVSKLVPGRMIAFMFGMWYLAIAIGNKLAATVGGMSEQIAKDHGMSTFFWILTLIPLVAGIAVILLNKPLKKLMHGVR